MKKLTSGQLGAITRKLNKVFTHAQANQNLLDFGLVWYKEANDICKAFAFKYEIEVSTVAKVVAILSPNITWQQNIVAADKLLKAFTQGKNWVKVAGYDSNTKKAFDVLNGYRDLERKGAKKTFSFHLNMLPEDNHATIDVWHLRACFNKDVNIGSGIAYDQIEALTQKLALKANMSTMQYQAVIWGAIKDIWATKDEPIEHDLRPTEEILNY